MCFQSCPPQLINYCILLHGYLPIDSVVFDHQPPQCTGVSIWFMVYGREPQKLLFKPFVENMQRNLCIGLL